jgi:mannosyltransferase OCH1-like enzyme
MTELLIPKIFHIIWLGDSPMPDEYIEYGKSWLENHPGWEMKLWNSENMINLQNQELYDNATYLAQKADIARYEILYNFGGIYIDTDFECLRNIENLLQNVEAFSAYESEGIINIAIMGCTPKNPVFKILVDGIPESIKSNKIYPINYQAGPIYATRKLRTRKDITIFRSELFYPYLWNEKHRKLENFPNAYAVHHWASSWVKKEDWDNAPYIPKVEELLNEKNIPDESSITYNKDLNTSNEANLFKYTVKPGDSLWDISLYFNIDFNDIIKFNNIIDAEIIHVGQILLLPLK